MSRPIGSKNKNARLFSPSSYMTSEERIEFLANIIVDRIMEDQSSGQKLLKDIEGTHAARTLAPA
jgi:hypothetical protein